jgi:hypothetical protein
MGSMALFYFGGKTIKRTPEAQREVRKLQKVKISSKFQKESR